MNSLARMLQRRKADSIKQPQAVDPIRENANYEGDHTRLLLERMRHPRIMDQMVALRLDDSKTESSNGTIKVQGETAIREDIEKYISAYERGEKIIVTDNPTIVPGMKKHTRDVIVSPKWLHPVDGELSPKVHNIITAHEVGHGIRFYMDTFYDNHFAPGFDTSVITITDTELVLQRKLEEKPSLTREDALRNIRRYLFSGRELVERMSQLKNYFGMRGGDVFTKEHLRYAREHYVKDIQFDNHMRQFFEAITPEKEQIFIDLINTSGV